MLKTLCVIAGMIWSRQLATAVWYTEKELVAQLGTGCEARLCSWLARINRRDVLWALGSASQELSYAT